MNSAIVAMCLCVPASVGGGGGGGVETGGRLTSETGRAVLLATLHIQRGQYGKMGWGWGVGEEGGIREALRETGGGWGWGREMRGDERKRERERSGGGDGEMGRAGGGGGDKRNRERKKPGQGEVGGELGKTEGVEGRGMEGGGVREITEREGGRKRETDKETETKGERGGGRKQLVRYTLYATRGVNRRESGDAMSVKL